MNAEQVQAERARVQSLLEGTTAGPWAWRGQHPHRDAIPKHPYLRSEVSPRYIVMDFVRHGMQGAQPRFLHRDTGAGIMRPVSEVGANWAQHPDAQLMAAAPDLAHSLLPALDTLAAAQTDIEGAHRLIDQRTRIVRHLPGEPETMTWRVDALTHLAEKYRGSLTTMTAEAREWRDRARAAEARVTALEAAVDAAIQCETDLLEVYQRRTSLSTLDLAVADLKRDSLPKLKAARTALTGGES